MKASSICILPEAVSTLGPFVEAGVFNDAEVQLCAAVERLSRNSGVDLAPEVLLAVAVAARGPRSGHVCVDLARVQDLIIDEDGDGVALPWPEREDWLEKLRSAPGIVTFMPNSLSDEVQSIPPLVLDGNNLYLQRYWKSETDVARSIIERSSTSGALDFSSDSVEEALDAFFGPAMVDGDCDWQRRGALAGLTRPFSVLSGGPGTGKTRTVARMLAVAHSLSRGDDRQLLVRLAAPSGKAATRMAEAIEVAVEELAAEGLIDDLLAAQLRNTQSTTIHSLLGANPRRGFTFDASNPLALDMVIVDESSMVSLPLMAALLEAVPEHAHLVLVGDPDQLASVQAGTVLGDIVAGASADPDRASANGIPTEHCARAKVFDSERLTDQITTLRVARRFRSDSAIAALATAVRDGDADLALSLLRAGGQVSWVQPDDNVGISALLDDIVADSLRAVDCARAGDASAALAALGSSKVLAATHRHPLGLDDWSERIESALFARLGTEAPQPWDRWYIGRPVIVTKNDHLLRIANGDVAITVERDGTRTVVFDGNPDDRLALQASRLDEVQTWWAMTIHKSQGSEFEHAIVSLPPADVPILTRELLYTAITRAKEKVTLIGTEEALRTGIAKPISRASGLHDRLWYHDGSDIGAMIPSSEATVALHEAAGSSECPPMSSGQTAEQLQFDIAGSP